MFEDVLLDTFLRELDCYEKHTSNSPQTVERTRNILLPPSVGKVEMKETYTQKNMPLQSDFIHKCRLSKW